MLSETWAPALQRIAEDALRCVRGTKADSGATSARPDPCAPIGRTAEGKLVYSMKCENLPAPPPPPPQAELKEAPPPAAEPEPEARRSGIFGWSYDRR